MYKYEITMQKYFGNFLTLGRVGFAAIITETGGSTQMTLFGVTHNFWKLGNYWLEPYSHAG